MDFGIAPPITRALHTAVESESFGYPPAAHSARLSVAYSDWAPDRYGWVFSDEIHSPLVHPGSRHTP